MKAPVHPLGFRGSDLGRCETPSVVVSCTDYPAGLTLPVHAHALPNLCGVLDGGFREAWGRGADELSSGGLLAKPGGAEHRDSFGPVGARCLNVDLRAEVEQRLEEPRLALLSPSVSSDPRGAGLCREIARELVEPDDLTPLAVEADVFGLIALFGPSRRARSIGRPEWLRSARDLVRDRFGESLKIESIAYELGVSPDHLARRFRGTYRCSIAEYIRRCRVERARELLSDPRVPLSEISLRCGFYDQSHFCRIFKRVTGLTPSAWRARS